MRRTLCLLVGAALLLPLPAQPRAYGANCALRNPDRQIYELFPAATSYRSVVRNVTTEFRAGIEQRVGAKIALNDLGKHTVYVVLNESKPIGFVHARSELGNSGTVELLWAIDLDLRVRDFRVQRSREKRTAAIKRPEFRARLLGKDASQLRHLTPSLRAGDTPPRRAAAKSIDLEELTFTCGVRTLVITEIVFADAVFSARLLGNSHRFFDQTSSVAKLRTPLDERALAAVKDVNGGDAAQLEADSLVVLRAVGAEGPTVGWVVYSKWAAHTGDVELWWAVSPTGTIERVIVVGPVDDATRSAAAALKGKRATDLAEASVDRDPSPVRAARELLAILSPHMERE